MNSRPRVLQLGKYYSPVKGGIETYVQSLCNRLLDSVELQVVVANHGRATVEEQLDGVRVIRCARLCTLSSAPICRGMAHAIRRFRPDIVHIHIPNPGAVIAYLLSGHRGPLVVSYHSDVVRQIVLNQAFDPILKHLLDRCSAIVATSQNYIDSSTILSKYVDRCHAIPYGIAPQSLETYDLSTVSAIRAKYGPRTVLAVGRLVYYKGFEYLIRAMQHVESSKLLIIGDGPLHRRLTQLIFELNLQSRVHLMGEIEDIVPYYHAADVFCLPSIARSEAFGMVQLEAMACGKPVINTALDSGVPFVSPHRVSGLTVPPADVSALAVALNQLLSNEADRISYGQAARQRVHSIFTLDMMIPRFLELYRDVLTDSSSFSLPAVAAQNIYCPQDQARRSVESGG